MTPSDKDPLKPTPLKGKNLRRRAMELQAQDSADQSRSENATPPPAEDKGVDPGVFDVRRKQLAALLWGDTDELESVTANDPTFPPIAPMEETKPLSKEETKKLKDSVEAAQDDPSASRNAVRRQCSFPGLLKVLLPEQSFQPRTFAVRIIDISPMGARVETRQLNEMLTHIINRERRHIRLEAMIPFRERVVIAGRLAWTEYDDDMSRVGLEFLERRDEFDDIFSPNADGTISPQKFALSPPRLDKFPSVTKKKKVHFTGIASEAEKITVSSSMGVIEKKVAGGKFEVEVPLKLETVNFLSFTASRGGVSSIPTPVSVQHRSDADDTLIPQRSTSLVDSFEVDGNRLLIKLSGSPARFFNALRLIEKTLEHADDVQLTFELTGGAEKAAQTLKPLNVLK